MSKVKGIGFAIALLVGIILVFTLAGNLIPTTQIAGDDLGRENSASCTAVGCFWNASGADQCVNTSTAPSGDCASTVPVLPLASLFGSTGLVFLLLGVALLLFVLAKAKLGKK